MWCASFFKKIPEKSFFYIKKKTHSFACEFASVNLSWFVVSLPAIISGANTLHQ
jgi:hypothetical protein